LLRYLSDQRRAQIHSHADPELGDGEEITHFARTRQPGSRQKGFIFMTSERVLITWKGDEESTPIDYADIRSWGVTHDQRGGPVLCIETPKGTSLVQLLTSSRAMIESAIRFLLLFGEKVPESAVAALEDGRETANVKPHLNVRQEPRTASELTRRILVTVFGVAIIISALLIIPLPGPWSLLLVIGGLALLATEYDWAEDALDWTKAKYQAARAKISARRKARNQAQG
jgi:uncharacterized protein (TIGR02611 family)